MYKCSSLAHISLLLCIQAEETGRISCLSFMDCDSLNSLLTVVLHRCVFVYAVYLCLCSGSPPVGISSGITGEYPQGETLFVIADVCQITKFEMIHELPLRLNLVRCPVPNRTHYHTGRCRTTVLHQHMK